MNSRRDLSKRSSGVALISVLLVVAVLLAVAANLMMRHSLIISQNQNSFSQTQAMQYALGAETLARQILYEDFAADPAIDHFGEVWAQATLPFELDEGGFLEAQIIDLQSCHNLNNILGSGPKPLERLKWLFSTLGAQPQLADAWKDWVDSDDEPTGFGAEDSEYLIAEVPHRAANVPVTDASEIWQLKDVTRDDLAVILPEVCVLPVPDTKLNVNTATAAALAALDRKIAPGSLTALVEAERAYTSPADFVADYDDFTDVLDQLAVKSEYFALHALAEVGETTFTLYSVLHRNPDDGGKITVLQRNFGKLFESNVEVATD